MWGSGVPGVSWPRWDPFSKCRGLLPCGQASCLWAPPGGSSFQMERGAVAELCAQRRPLLPHQPRLRGHPYGPVLALSLSP